MKKIWIEYLRVLAVAAVVTIHVTSSIYREFGTIQNQVWWLANILNTFSRFSVPIFVMISGSVLLGRNMGIKDFYLKRGFRLLPAFFFWSFFYIAFSYLINDRDLSFVLRASTIRLFITGSAYPHLWYLSMFICLTLFVPFINNYIVGSKPTFTDFVYLFIIFAVFMALNQISDVGAEIFNKNMYWFKLFPWYVCYFMSGYFIDVYSDRIIISNKTLLVILGAILSAACILNYYSASSLGIVKDYFILSYTGILNFIVTVLIFYWFSKNRNVFQPNRLIASISSMSFGIYLIHPVFITFFKRAAPYYIENPIVGLPLIIVLTFCFSYLIIVFLTRMKWFKYLC